MRQLPKYDSVDSIMDRIDAELLKITGYGVSIIVKLPICHVMA
jgi:hypothetical protein